MTERTFADSIYRFTDPVRIFTANDPYYYKVDNIPIQQLNENDNFLKDQIENLLLSSTEVSRETFTELKPYVDGTNNIVKVKPGKYSARINDAYDINPLQFLTKLVGERFDTWQVGTNLNSFVSDILEKFKTELAANALGMNGLTEKTFTYGVLDVNNVGNLASSSAPEYYSNPLNVPFPTSYGKVWSNATTQELEVIGKYLQNSFQSLGNAEPEFIKRWRGIARTSIVNVEEELEIEIPPLNAEDFFYIDENGTKVLIPTDQRIDLVFIYSKPIDVSSTTIPKFVNNSPTKITQPILGLVKGAGVGVVLKTIPNGFPLAVNQDENGNKIILSNLSDKLQSNAGIGDIKGSFPSPDDLMNLSPLIEENLSHESYALLGQSILPVAYVISRSTQATNSQGVKVITSSDLIDIRPFFRTTELAYNERAGIAAAVPQISLANPVASEAFVDKMIRDLKDQIGASESTQASPIPRIVGSGYIKGGYNFGVESTLGSIIINKYNIPEANTNQIKQEIINRFGYPNGTQINDLPDWDVAERVRRQNLPLPGEYPTDYINYKLLRNTAAEFGCYTNQAKTSRSYTLATEEYANASNVQQGHSVIYFVKKTIQIDRSRISWASDYHVDAQLFNCLPMTCRSKPLGSNELVDAAGGAGIWVEKKENEFTIYVSWVAKDWQTNFSVNSLPGETFRDTAYAYTGFNVINTETINSTNTTYPNSVGSGVALYPTVTFQVYGIPSTFGANAVNLNTERPILTLE